MSYLRRVDPANADSFIRRLKPYLTQFHLDLSNLSNATGYRSLKPLERDSLSGCIEDLVSIFERKQGAYGNQ